MRDNWRWLSMGNRFGAYAGSDRTRPDATGIAGAMGERSERPQHRSMSCRCFRKVRLAEDLCQKLFETSDYIFQIFPFVYPFWLLRSCSDGDRLGDSGSFINDRIGLPYRSSPDLDYLFVSCRRVVVVDDIIRCQWVVKWGIFL